MENTTIENVAETLPADDEAFVNGWFTLAVPSSGAKASIKKIVRHAGKGKPVTADDILAKLKKQNVSYGIDVEAINRLIDEVENNNIPEEEIVIASADVEHGENGTLEWFVKGIDDKETLVIVKPGTILANRILATKGKTGKNIFGKRVQARPGFDQQLEAGHGITMTQDKDNNVVYKVSSTGKLIYQSNVISVDPLISISDDKLEAHMDLYAKNSINDEMITVDDIITTIQATGIIEGIQESKIKQELISLKDSNVPSKNVLIAKGEDAIDGTDAKIDWLIKIQAKSENQRAVVPGQLIATRTPPSPSKAGKNILGEKIEAQDGAMNPLPYGEGIVKKENEGIEEFYSQYLGYLISESGELKVVREITVTDDKMQASMRVYPKPDYQGASVVLLEHVVSSLAAYGITYGIQQENINKSLLETKQNKKPFIDIVVAEGTQPKHGVNAKLIIEFKESIGKLLADGSIDYNEKSYPWNILKGQNIGHIIPSQPAQDGTNVLGETLPAIAAEEANLVLENVSQGDDGKIRAECDGVLLINGLNIKVTDSLVIEKNIDHQTGNISTDSSVIVKGNVIAGHQLRALKNDAVIHENVENAHVYARGSVLVKGGIRGTNSEVAAGMGIAAAFSENTKLMACKDITISNSLLNCDTYCKGLIRIGDRGSAKSTIVGGITRSQKGIEAANLGSESQRLTNIQIGPGPAIIDKFNELTKEIEKKQIEKTDLENVYNRYQQEPGNNKKQLLEKIANTLSITTTTIKGLTEKKEFLSKKINQAKKATIVVYKHVYPGVQVHILDKKYIINEKRDTGIFCIKGDQIIYKKPE